jgi:hypothetical protein
MIPTDALPRSLRLLERPAARQVQALAKKPSSAVPSQSQGWTAVIDRCLAWGERLHRSRLR